MWILGGASLSRSRGLVRQGDSSRLGSCSVAVDKVSQHTQDPQLMSESPARADGGLRH